MYTTSFLVILFIATLLTLFIAPKITIGGTPDRYNEPGDPGRPLSRLLALIPLSILAFSVMLSCTAIVDAKTEGVLLTFKAPSDRLLDSGLAVKAPWQDVVEIDGTRKTDNFNDSKPNDEDDPTQDHTAIKCRLGDNGVATVYATIQWYRAEGSSNRVYEQYRSDDPVEAMRDNLVAPRFKEAVNEACGTYQPTAVIDQLDVDFTDPQATAKAMKGLKLSPDFAKLSSVAEANFKAKLGDDPLVTVEHIAISYMALPGTSEGAIQDFRDEAQKARTALLSQSTAAATAEANRIRSKSVPENPNALVSRCFDLIADGKLKLEAGTSCWPGGSSGIIVPTAR